MSSEKKENFIVEWKIRLPGSKTPVVFPLHLGMTAEEAINVICRHYSLKNKKLTVVLSPTATNPGKIIPEDTVLRSLESEVDSEDILELWKSPYTTKAAVVDGTSSVGTVREVVVDASRELSQMIPIFQRAFGIKEEFCLQHSPLGMGGTEDSTFKNVSLIARAKWLSISDSLLNQRIPQDSYILVFPIYLFEKFCSTLLQKTPSTREGLLQKQSKTKNKVSKTEERWFVLNEGFLFYFKKKGDSTPRGVLTLEYYTMKHFKVENDKKNRWTIQLSKVFAGEFVSKHGDFYMLYGSEQDVKDWAADIAHKCYTTGTRREFGVDLLQASQRRLARNSIPRVMQDCVEYLKQEGASYEGLFRVPGSASLIEYYKDQYDQGEEVNLSECNDPHTVAGLLKLYVREMPEPLLTFGLYDKLLTAFENYYESGEKTATEQIAKVVSELPSINTLVLRYLCNFLSEMGKNHQKTKMTVSNLATVFGPNLIRSQEEDVSILMKHAPAINNILEILINNQERIFGVVFIDIFSFLLQHYVDILFPRQNAN
eukprot:TRINITY_DN1220_c0_g1_i3.p1 TRINITY_DN1220_c0_g1~~TRINITY_DN1220_c0_g1_i3.p1  ORF type:complete len:541 (+),score=106.66 TRINITY_DN1220_c0_g1_i3:182-1804(+)